VRLSDIYIYSGKTLKNYSNLYFNMSWVNLNTCHNSSALTLYTSYIVEVKRYRNILVLIA